MYSSATNMNTSDREQQVLRMMAALGNGGGGGGNQAVAATTISTPASGLGPLCHTQFLPSWQEAQAQPQQQQQLSQQLVHSMLHGTQHGTQHGTPQVQQQQVVQPSPASQQNNNNNNDWLLQNLKDVLAGHVNVNVQQQPPHVPQPQTTTTTTPPLNLQDLFQVAAASQQQQQQPPQPPAHQQDSVTDWIRAMMNNLVHQQQPHLALQQSSSPFQDATVVSAESSSQDYNGSSSNSSLGEDGAINPSSHEQMWKTRYQELQQFHQTYGHSLVPMNWPSNPSLAHWVKRQRYQYKLKYNSNNSGNSNSSSSSSTLTAEREAALRRLHFVWDSHAASWEERYQELIQFKAEHGHANVPKHFPSNPKLSIWVKCQRRQYKLLLQNKKSNMTLPRFTKLQQVGFCFCPRGNTGGNRGKGGVVSEPIPEALLRQAAAAAQQQQQALSQV